MSNSSRFTIAVHTLTLLAQNTDESVTSEYLAGSVNTNPVVIRRVLGALRAAGLVTSRGGNGGGWQLARGPHVITLRCVYRAVEEPGEPLFPLHPRNPSSQCPVGRNIQRSLSVHFDAAKRALEDELARATIGDILHEVLVPTG